MEILTTMLMNQCSGRSERVLCELDAIANRFPNPVQQDAIQMKDDDSGGKMDGADDDGDFSAKQS